jgi:hypothetical protein
MRFQMDLLGFGIREQRFGYSTALTSNTRKPESWEIS